MTRESHNERIEIIIVDLWVKKSSTSNEILLSNNKH